MKSPVKTEASTATEVAASNDEKVFSCSVRSLYFLVQTIPLKYCKPLSVSICILLFEEITKKDLESKVANAIKSVTTLEQMLSRKVTSPLEWTESIEVWLLATQSVVVL